MKVLITLLAVLAACHAVSYEGYWVMRVVPGTTEGVERFQSLLQSPEVRVWKEHGGEKRAFDVMVSPSYYQTFIRELEIHVRGHAYTMIDDVQKQIDEQMAQNEMSKNSKKMKVKPFHHIDNSYYRNLDEIYSLLDNFASNFSSIMSLSSVGTTYEGRDILLMKISTDSAANKEVVWIDCGIHAREWVTPASCLFYIDMLSEYAEDPTVGVLLDRFDFYVLTVVNPDGYAFTWDSDRLWKKNRVPGPGGTCVGTDLNCNFDAGFGGPGSSDQQCSDTFHGPSAFSELETQALRDQIVGLNGRVVQYYNMRSYSQLWMYPYGYTSDLSADDAEQNRVASIGVAALTAVYGTPFEFGPISTTIYLTSGSSVDWAYDAAGVVYSYTLEMRDQGQYGFLLPPEQIEPVATESWEGVKAAVTAIL